MADILHILLHDRPLELSIDLLQPLRYWHLRQKLLVLHILVQLIFVPINTFVHLLLDFLGMRSFCRSAKG